ncbi:hypothetical protein EHS13_27290 [Paenibacillus psychroresistens]|uniref:Glycosyl hydrolase family 43 n=1 Tax=Paenibacillus psychroresistens TaxID=1778678 RepID=A0A6B8RRZ2_9BACL|nr:hypothetical protein [Paenibacillus psychroresistens]QGQ98325.1 hypothetical protein EHS13_27290 [Paenibacillus psychroresistens]
MITILNQHEKPVLFKGVAGTENNQFGFEGGTIVKLDGVYHLFTSEMVGMPMWVKMRLAHWISDDRLHFRRQSTLFESSGNYDGTDPRAAFWSPMPVYDELEGRWSLTYIAYRCAPDAPDRMLINHEGKIWRAVSAVLGEAGIGGPYEDAGILMQPGVDSDPWEGLQGTDSFYPYPVGDSWYAFYGSAHTQKFPIDWWGVGLASAPELAGPWQRCSSINPVLIDDKFVENPMVRQLEDGSYIAWFDGGPEDLGCRGTIGYSLSADGINWSKGNYVWLDSAKMDWQKLMRTPLCFIPEGDGVYTLYYTAMDHSGYGCIGLLDLKLS